MEYDLSYSQSSRSRFLRKPARLFLLPEHLGSVAFWYLAWKQLVGKNFVLVGIVRWRMFAGTTHCVISEIEHCQT